MSYNMLCVTCPGRPDAPLPPFKVVNTALTPKLYKVGYIQLYSIGYTQSITLAKTSSGPGKATVTGNGQVLVFGYLCGSRRDMEICPQAL
jgi:hypothetical protein